MFSQFARQEFGVEPALAVDPNNSRASPTAAPEEGRARAGDAPEEHARALLLDELAACVAALEQVRSAALASASSTLRNVGVGAASLFRVARAGSSFVLFRSFGLLR
jgi:hypothetical protein